MRSPLCPWYLRDYSLATAAPSVVLAWIFIRRHALQSVRPVRSFCLSDSGWVYAFGGTALLACTLPQWEARLYRRSFRRAI